MINKPNQTPFSSAPKTILLAGLLVGTLDILSAFVDYYIATGKNPLIVLTFIAGGAFGKSAFSGGAGMMIMGLLFHYFIAYSFTLFFFWLYPRLAGLSKNRIIIAIAYGIFIWCVMNLIVIQLSALPHRPISQMKFYKIIKAMLILIFMIGFPLSFIVHGYYQRKTRELNLSSAGERQGL